MVAQVKPESAAEISGELARGKFTDEMLAEMRALIGTELRTEASVNNEYATRLAILRFAEGIGDDNPLWTDPGYAAASPYGGLIAPPSFIFCCLGSIQVGWRGLGGFHAETLLTFHRTVRLDDRITARVYFDGFDGPSESRFAGRRIKDYLRQEYRNQDGELVATFICSRIRFERSEAQSRRETRAIQVPHPWTEAELEAIEDDMLAETPRGRAAALLGRRPGRRRAGHDHQGPARAHRRDRLHRFRRRPDPAPFRSRRGACGATASTRAGRSATPRRTPSNRSTRCTTTTTRPGCKAPRRPTTSASSAPAGRSTR